MSRDADPVGLCMNSIQFSLNRCAITGTHPCQGGLMRVRRDVMHGTCGSRSEAWRRNEKQEIALSAIVRKKRHATELAEIPGRVGDDGQQHILP